VSSDGNHLVFLGAVMIWNQYLSSLARVRIQLMARCTWYKIMW